MTCTALFVGGPCMDVRTDGSQFWNLAPKELTARSSDGRFERYQIPPAADSNGADLPAIARALRPSLWNRMFCAAFAHDAAFRGTLLRWDKESKQWVPANLSEEDANELILALMFIDATSEAERVIIFEVLQAFGKKAFDQDRAALSPGAKPGG